MQPVTHPISIAILGGTGREGKGLAFRWALAGYKVIIGSRSKQRAQTIASEINLSTQKGPNCQGMDNLEAAGIADVIVITVPYSAHRNVLEQVRHSIQSKLVIDVTVPFTPPVKTKVSVPPAGSAAQETLGILGREAKVCTAFQNIAYEKLIIGEQHDSDVLVTGSSLEARTQTLALVKDAGFSGVDAGPIENSMVVEGLASILIYINKKYCTKNAGIKITGIQ